MDPHNLCSLPPGGRRVCCRDSVEEWEISMAICVDYTSLLCSYSWGGSIDRWKYRWIDVSSIFIRYDGQDVTFYAFQFRFFAWLQC